MKGNKMEKISEIEQTQNMYLELIHGNPFFKWTKAESRLALNIIINQDRIIKKLVKMLDE